MNDTLVLTLSRLEEALHQPSVRTDAAQLAALLHPDFEEIGRSGQHYALSTVIAELTKEKPAGTIIADNYLAKELSPAVALLTYRSAHRLADGTLTKHSLRSSIWLWVDGRWRLRYHQGTPTTDIW